MSETGFVDANLKITFVVTSRQDPELFNWLQTHPFKSTSAAVRALLNIGAAAMVAMREAGSVLPSEDMTAKTSSKPQPQPRKRYQSPKTPKASQRQSATTATGQEAAPPTATATESATVSQVQAVASKAQPVPPSKPAFVPVQVFNLDKDSNSQSSSQNDLSDLNDNPDINAALDAFNVFDRRF
jgi:hypothetical protein